MKMRFQKDMRVISDLLIFCHCAGAHDYEVHYQPSTEVSRFEIRAKIDHIDDELYKSLIEALSLGRMREVEQNYWELGASMDSTPELSLVGMMLDHSVANYENGVLTITAERDER